METFKILWDSIIGYRTLLWLVPTLAILLYFGKYIRFQYRFAKNLKRKVYFLKTSSEKPMQTQLDNIVNLKLFNIEKDIKDISQGIDGLQNLKKDAVYIVGYSKDYQKYQDLFNYAKHYNIPVIIFAAPGEIKGDCHKLIADYIYCDMANTTHRLAIILVNTFQIL